MLEERLSAGCSFSRNRSLAGVPNPQKATEEMMPKNIPSDPITLREMAFAQLVLSGTMDDRRAAEAVGLDPDSAADIKSKPGVRAYMLEHRTAAREKLVDQEGDRSRKLDLGREQILAQLWELANLSPDATRGNIAGQVKALAMIADIEGLIPSGATNERRDSETRNQPAAQPAAPRIYTPGSRRLQ